MPAYPTKQIKPSESVNPRIASLSKPNALPLFHANLNAMREWYRARPDAGYQCGINVAMELAVTDTLTALGNALEGKTWEPPSA